MSGHLAADRKGAAVMHARRLVIPAALAALGLAAAMPAAAQTQPGPNVLYPANVDYPSSGGYGVVNSTVLGEPYVQGADVNMDWSSVETSNDPPNAPTYDWTGLDNEATAAYDQGKHIILVVRAANETGGATVTNGVCKADSDQILPSWEISSLQKYQGMNGSNGIYCDTDLETMVPDWFSSTFQNDFKTFISALGQYASQQPWYHNISYIRIGVGLGGEAFPVMPDDTPSGCSPSTPPCQTDAAADLATITNDWVPTSETFPQAWENFQESMLTAYDADFPAVAGTGGATYPPPTLIYPISVIPGQEPLPDGDPEDYGVANWATSTYSNIGIGQQCLAPGGLDDYADFENIVPMVFANNPDVYIQFQTCGTTTSTAEELGIIQAAEGYGARSIEWYESTWQGNPLAPPSTNDMTQYQTWVNNNCDPGCPVMTISGVAPTTGTVGTTVTITGHNLANASAVAFNGTQATIVSDSATQIVTKVPTGATSGFIMVTTPNGTTTSPASFTVTS
jgi:hypothetical protein